jgi:hypothetical protein
LKVLDYGGDNGVFSYHGCGVEERRRRRRTMMVKLLVRIDDSVL